MNKAILVIDMPNNCNECPIRSSIGYGKWCSGYDDARIDNCSEKPDWCPLKELPEKSYTGKSDYYQFGNWEDGWNACIDTILNEQIGNKDVKNMFQDCKYRLPCAWCDKHNQPCKVVQYKIHEQEQEKNIGKLRPTECEHDWVLYESFVHTGGKDLRYRCKKCGAHMIKNGEITYQSGDEWQT